MLFYSDYKLVFIEMNSWTINLECYHAKEEKFVNSIKANLLPVISVHHKSLTRWFSRRMSGLLHSAVKLCWWARLRRSPLKEVGCDFSFRLASSSGYPNGKSKHTQIQRDTHTHTQADKERERKMSEYIMSELTEASAMQTNLSITVMATRKLCSGLCAHFHSMFHL